MSFLSALPYVPSNGTGSFLTAFVLCQGVAFILFGVAVLPIVVFRIQSR